MISLNIRYRLYSYFCEEKNGNCNERNGKLTRRYILESKNVKITSRLKQLDIKTTTSEYIELEKFEHYHVTVIDIKKKIQVIFVFKRSAR